MFNLWKIQLKIKCQELYDENIKLKKENEQLIIDSNNLHNIKSVVEHDTLDPTSLPVHKLSLNIDDINEIINDK